MSSIITFCCNFNAIQCLEYMTCLQFSGSMHWTLPQATRFAHLLLITAVFLFAIILGTVNPDYFDGSSSHSSINLTGDCDSDYETICIYRQLIYRASFAVFILSCILAMITPFSNYAHRSLWFLKSIFAFGLFISFWYVNNTVFSLWAQIARHLAFFWLVIQALLLLDLVYDWHEDLMDRADDLDKNGKSSYHIYGMYLTVCLIGLVLSLIGIIYLYNDYSNCRIGLAFTSITLLMGIITTVISLWYPVNRGFLTPCIMFAYCVFKCWYALLSDPNSTCDQDASTANQDLALAIILIVTILVLLYCVFNGTPLLNAFDLSQGEGVLRSYRAKKSKGSSFSRSMSSRDDNTIGDIYGNSPRKEANRRKKENDEQYDEWKTLLISSNTSSNSRDSKNSSKDKTSASKTQSMNRDIDGTNRVLEFDRQESEIRDMERIVVNEGGSGNTAEESGESYADVDSGTMSERLYFHMMMILAVMYGAMLLTSWGSTSGAPGDSTIYTEAQAYESMWVKIFSQWVFLLLYLRALQVAYEDNITDEAWNDL